MIPLFPSPRNQIFRPPSHISTRRPPLPPHCAAPAAQSRSCASMNLAEQQAQSLCEPREQSRSRARAGISFKKPPRKYRIRRFILHKMPSKTHCRKKSHVTARCHFALYREEYPSSCSKAEDMRSCSLREMPNRAATVRQLLTAAPIRRNACVQS